MPMPMRSWAARACPQAAWPPSSRNCAQTAARKPAFWPTNPAPSSYAVIAAQAAGGGDLAGLVAGLTRACWAEEKDISQDEVIVACLEAAGFDGSLATSGMLQGAETYAANLEEAVNAGAFGAPFFICDSGERFWGEDRIADLDAHLAGKV